MTLNLSASERKVYQYGQRYWRKRDGVEAQRNCVLFGLLLNGLGKDTIRDLMWGHVRLTEEAIVRRGDGTSFFAATPRNDGRDNLTVVAVLDEQTVNDLTEWKTVYRPVRMDTDRVITDIDWGHITYRSMPLARIRELVKDASRRSKIKVDRLGDSRALTAAIIQRRQAGLPIKDIATELHITQSAVNNRIHTFERKQWCDERRRKSVPAHESGELNITIDVLDLPVRVGNALKRAGLLTVADVLGREHELHLLRGLGPTGIETLRAKLNDYRNASVNEWIDETSTAVSEFARIGENILLGLTLGGKPGEKS